jgi:hypothetical protein
MYRDAGHAIFVDDAPRFNRELFSFASGRCRAAKEQAR